MFSNYSRRKLIKFIDLIINIDINILLTLTEKLNKKKLIILLKIIDSSDEICRYDYFNIENVNKLKKIIDNII